MRILIVSQYFWPENFRINDLVRELSQKGHQLTVLTGKPNYPSGDIFPEYQQTPEKYTHYDNLPIIRVPIITRGQSSIRLLLNYISFAVSASLIGGFKLRKTSFDVIFVFEPSPISVGIPAIVFKKTHKIPIVFWVLDLWPETLSAVGVVKSTFFLKIIGVFVSFIYNRCDRILGQSHGFKQGINQYCNDKRKFRYFPNWSESTFETETTQRAPEIPFNDACFNIIFTGNIGESQDFLSILTAAEQLAGNGRIKWYIIGEGRMLSWVKNEVKKRALHDCFYLLGRFPLERMPSFYNAASALLVALKPNPIFSLTIPGKVQSYMAAGKPILAMLDGEGEKLINISRSGFVSPSGNPDKLIKNIIKMSSMRQQTLDKIGQNGKTYAQQEFSKTRLINRLERWLLEVSK
ncbi:MAG: glycosyltransferase family 4 protein [Cocleimonas sp.]|nr:glycosyltransferase family 4 protein [Cocleimonas sp.]